MVRESGENSFLFCFENFVISCKVERYSKMNESLSVYELVTRLCSSVVKESDESVDGFDLNTAKRIAFEVLLKNNFQSVPESENLIQELQFSSFELSLANKHKEAKQVTDFIENVKNNASDVESITWCLVHLKSIDPEQEEKHQVRADMKIADLHATYY